MIIKVCGMNNVDNLMAISYTQPDFFGFIFYKKSPRFLTLNTLPQFDNIKKIGVFINESKDVIIESIEKFQLDGIQLHGEEDVNLLLNIKRQIPNKILVFKAFQIKFKEDFMPIEYFEGHVDKVILDTKSNKKGGSGKQFDWALLKYYKAKIPFLLSGGIRPDDAKIINDLYDKYPLMQGVDINSGFEISPGLKDKDKVKTFITKLK